MEIELKNKKLQFHWEKKARLLRREKNCNKKCYVFRNLSKLFIEADEIFDTQKIDLDGDLLKITIPNTQTTFKELNNKKLPEELIFLLGGTDGGNELKFYALQKTGMLNKSNEHLLDYLLSDFSHKVLSKN